VNSFVYLSQTINATRADENTCILHSTFQVNKLKLAYKRLKASGIFCTIRWQCLCNFMFLHDIFMQSREVGSNICKKRLGICVGETQGLVDALTG
jgi:hypothetical protein